MNKPISLVIKDTQVELAKVCNNSGLSPVILDLIMQGIYSEIHALAEKQLADEKNEYVKKLESENKEK